MADELKPNRKGPHAYAIIRYDAFHGEDVRIEHRITVKKVVFDAFEAEREVARLNELKRGKDSYYFHQVTRLEGVPAEAVSTAPPLVALDEAA